MKVNLVGCGGISKCHLNAIKVLKNKNIVLSSVADIIPERADNTATEMNCKAYYNYIDMLECEKPDIVHICTPHYLHVDMAVEALNRNINVVLEKPCATSVDGLKRLIEAENKSEGKVALFKLVILSATRPEAFFSDVKTFFLTAFALNLCTVWVWFLSSAKMLHTETAISLPAEAEQLQAPPISFSFRAAKAILLLRTAKHRAPMMTT